MNKLDKIREVCRDRAISVVGLIAAVRAAQDCNLQEAIDLAHMMICK